MGRTYLAVANKISLLHPEKFKRETNNNIEHSMVDNVVDDSWSDEDLEILKEFSGSTSIEDMIQPLNKTKEDILSKTEALGLVINEDLENNSDNEERKIDDHSRGKLRINNKQTKRRRAQTVKRHIIRKSIGF